MAESIKWLTYKEQVVHCKERGITFNKISEFDAEEYLRRNNNFFKLRSYRKNFIKRRGSNQYVNLDFFELIDLAVIDSYLRNILLKMSLNIEHFSKVALLCRLSESTLINTDIIDEYITQLNLDSMEALTADLNKNKNSIYSQDLFDTYLTSNNFKSLPVWVFIEMISFGQYLSFYKYCADKLDDKNLINNFYLMLTVKNIRNASAHNTCIINDFISLKNFKPNFELTRNLSFLGQANRKAQLKKIRVYHILAVLYTHKKLVSSKRTHEHISCELSKLKYRFYRNNSFTNKTIKCVFDTIIKVIDFWYPIS